ncbi:mitochondrial GTPase 1 isoform X2 [Diaphorina citri]|uniref:Mitochondrial GTPase 1 n=1 Tax=Diaphorina citri TaxID=121845 RepID=A0A1S3CZH5_DIACI|nr:mitochondrial GTPase 1 isoform X1 [Diaphorina citri]XP_008471033.1 mitochondrial GTPase 1 isoform X1 [Diaphorina citri]XP_026678716.1 mitochondrial GTPase 1 isoform X2 [Diaphorina citri]
MSKVLKNAFTLSSMRSKFEVSQARRQNIQWFPGHMGRGLKDIEKHLKNVDIVIEVHDSRMPFTGRNHLLQQSVQNIRPMVLVLNKRDLINSKHESLIEEKVRKEQSHISEVIFTNCRNPNCKGVQKILPTLQHISDNMTRYHRTEVYNTTVMVVGVPNVGKSSIINALRSSHMKKGKAVPVGPKAGVTRSVMSQVKISEKPLIYILDTPGISLPRIDNLECGMRLAACATLQDHLVGEINIADYILFYLNRTGNYRYVDFFNLDEPSDDIVMLLAKAAIKKKWFKRAFDVSSNSVRMFPDTGEVARIFIEHFRKGSFGSVMLDRDFLELDIS